MRLTIEETRGTKDGATVAMATEIRAVVYNDEDPDGAVFRLADGRLAVLTVSSVADGVEDTILGNITGQILGGGTSVLSTDMRSLGVDDGLQAWAEGQS